MQSGQHASTSAPDGAGPAAAPQLPPTFIQEIFQVSLCCMLCQSALTAVPKTSCVVSRLTRPATRLAARPNSAA